MKKEIKVEWCENYIKKTFAKLPQGITGIYTGLFWKKAEEAGFYEKNTYGSPMSKALEKLVKVENHNDKDGNFLYSTFALK